VPWLLGRAGQQAFEAIQARVAARSRPPACFPAGGYAIMRSRWNRDAHQMIVDVGPLGCSVSGGHGHADLLSIQCSIFGEPCLVDAGNYCYTPEAQWRDHFRSTAAHNTSWWMGRARPSHPGRSDGAAGRASGCASGIRHLSWTSSMPSTTRAATPTR
jgi:hypothetical protein